MMIAMIGVGVLMYGIRVFNGETSWGELEGDIDLDGSGGVFGDRHLSGVHRGVPVEVYSESRAEDGHHRFYVVYEATLGENVPSGLAMEPERATPVHTPDGLKFDAPGLADKLAAAAGGQDVQVGDRILDDTFVIEGDDPDEVRRYLRDPEISSAVMELNGPDFHTVRIYDRTVEVRRRGGPQAGAVVEQHLDTITECVRVMNGQPAEPADDEEPGRAEFLPVD